MLDRLFILISVVLAVGTIWYALRVWRNAKLRGLRAQTPFARIVPPGVPAVVAFSAPHCQECHTLQAPALQRLKSFVAGRVTIATLSALDHPDLVEHLGILTVPSTVVLDANRTVRHLNLGYASDAKLRDQLAQY